MSRIVTRRFYRSRADRMLGGVSGGLAAYFDIDPTVVRLLWVFGAVLSGGLFAIAYLVLWIVVPEEPRGLGSAMRRVEEEAMPGSGSRAAGQAEVEGFPPAGLTAEELEALEGTPDAEPARRRRRVWAGLLLIALGAIFLANNLGLFWWFNWRYFWPVLLIGFGLLLLFFQSRR